MMKTPLVLSLALLFIGISHSQAALRISEIVADNEASLLDIDQEAPDWIEIHNPDDMAVSLDGYFLSDDPDNLTRWAFPEVEIPAGGYLIVFASGKDRRDPTGELHLNFRLSASGEYLALVNGGGTQIVSAFTPRYPPLGTDHSYGWVEIDDGGSYEISNQPSPGEANATNVVLFSLESQAFTDSLSLELSSPSGEGIRYTVDGSEPSLFSGKNYSGPIAINETTLIGAKAGGGPLYTNVFIRITPELAEMSSNIPLVIADASKSLNQTSLAEMAIAIIEPSGEDQRARMISEFTLASRGGIRTRGETSNSFPKKPLRFEFWDGKDEDRALSPLGLPADGDWIMNARYEFDRTLMHNAWIYELSNELGQWAPHTRFVELYLNDDDSPVSVDDYNGIYTFMETISRGNDRVDIDRMEASVTEEPDISGGYLFKKDKDDPGVWRFNGGGESGLQMVYPREEERSDRVHQASWLGSHLTEMNNAILDHGSDPENGYPKYIDTQAWIDHHLLNFLPNNVDALRLSAYFHKPRGGKVVAGPVWDFDRSAGGPSDGRINNPLQWGDGGGGTAFFVRGNHGTPVWWENLFDNPDFMQQWLDRWYELRHTEMVTASWDDTPLPAFSEANINRIFDHMAETLAEAQERNFDRWSARGPRNASQLRYSDVGGHEGEVEYIKGWLKARIDWIEEQFIQVPAYTPAEAAQSGETNVTIKAGGSVFKKVDVYYTLDGSDPRASGGEPSVQSVKYDNPLTLTSSLRLKSRRIDNTVERDRWGPPLQWSGLADTYFFIDTVPVTASNVVISEIMYHPADPTEDEIAAGFTNDDDFEFVELLNISNDRVDFASAKLRGAADFDFSDGTVLDPGARLVLVSNAEAFAERYGTEITPAGVYRNQLGNAGATIRLRDYRNAIVREFAFEDDAPWPEEADGEGRSLVLTSPDNNPDPAIAASWNAGETTNGTPGAAESNEGGGNPGEPSGFDAWLAGQFDASQLADATVSGPNADADGDYLPTLAEYYLAGHALVSEPDKLPTISRQGQIEYSRQSGITDVTVTVEISVDLNQWEDATAQFESSVVTKGGTEFVTLTHKSDLVGAQYVRLRFTK